MSEEELQGFNQQTIDEMIKPYSRIVPTHVVVPKAVKGQLQATRAR
jgi:hypothetical protein